MLVKRRANVSGVSPGLPRGPLSDVMRRKPSKEEAVMRSVAILLMLIGVACLSGCAGDGSGSGGMKH